MHLVPAGLLALALLIVVICDLIMGRGTTAGGGVDADRDAHGQDQDAWTYNVKDARPKLGLQFSDENARFGLQMIGVKDPREGYEDKFKQLTYDEQGRTNNTIVKITDYEYFFGEKTPDNVFVGKMLTPLPNKRHGYTTTMDFTQKKVRVKQHVEIVPSQSGYLDTCLVWYHVENYGDVPQKVGVRVMLDTFIGANDGVPFTAPGVKGFIDTARTSRGQGPAVSGGGGEPERPKNPGTVARIGLMNIRLPGVQLEDRGGEDLSLPRRPHRNGIAPVAKWEAVSIQGQPPDSKPDSSVFIYWRDQEMKPKAERDMAFTYGLGQLDIGTAAATRPGARVRPTRSRPRRTSSSRPTSTTPTRAKRWS